MSIPVLETQRLRLRPFEERDLPALAALLGDREVNAFLPWFPVESLEEAQVFWEERFCPRPGCGWVFALCLKEEDVPRGYLTVGERAPFDFGYALAKEWWGRGFATEAGVRVLEHLRQEGLPYVTATHDVKNPRSGAVMRRLGMTYRYSYWEQWQPKDIPVLFRMYQLDLDGEARPAYSGYWQRYPKHLIETDL